MALVNSLRLLGHHEWVHVLDCGFTPWQRALLARDRRVATVAAEKSWNPMLLKAALPLAHPAQVMVVVDVDVIFTRRIDELVSAAAADSKSILFPDEGWPDRFEPAWEQLGYGFPVRHPYIASGQLVLSGEEGIELLTLWSRGLEYLASKRILSSYGHGPPPDEDPFYFPDMDVLNALIGTAIPLDRFVVADATAAAYPPFEHVRIVDADRLVVEADEGPAPFLLHHFKEKPWSDLVAANAYSRLMTRLLCRDDVAIRPSRRHVPLSLRPGIAGAAGRSYVNGRLWERRTMRHRLRRATTTLRSRTPALSIRDQ